MVTVQDRQKDRLNGSLGHHCWNTMSVFHQNPSAMEPMMPTRHDVELGEQTACILKLSGALYGRLPTGTSEAIAEILRLTNCYYSNLIEGHTTHPADIERAMRMDFSTEPRKKNLQIEARAHIEVQKAMERKLASEPDLNVFSKEFLCWLHYKFYEHLPLEFRTVKNPKTNKILTVEPGHLRSVEVTVGRHLAPAADSLESFLDQFSEIYNNPRITASRRVLVMAASHHRLAWIHPFLDGNGRVARLFSNALAIKNCIHGQGLWSISRGLARTRDSYYEHLNNADRVRENDVDGRGNLSDSRLFEFCTYFLDQVIDQMKFMHELISPGSLERQIEIYVESRDLFGKQRNPAIRLLKEAVTQGEFARGQASAITGKSDSNARKILGAVLDAGLLVSETEKGKVRIALPTKVLDVYFPGLFPLIQSTK
jgi:Fic family protein